MSTSKFAAVGSDGIRDVVWGIGETEEAALMDARSELDQLDPRDSNVELTVIPITHEQDSNIKAGFVVLPI